MVILRSAQEASLFQPVATIPDYFGFCLWIAEFLTNQFLSILDMLDFHAPAILSAMTRPCWYNFTPRPASQNNGALDRRVFLGILRSPASRRNIQSLFSLALSLCAALSRVRGR